ncbi:hypothetical protein AAVH_13910, partial [Aphelenchoides avenae]
LLAQNEPGPSGQVSLITVDDVQYAMPVSLGRPRQTLYLTVDFEQYHDLLVSGVQVPGYATRTFFNRALASTFNQTGLSKEAVFGIDTIELDGGKEYNATSLKVLTDVIQARQLYDTQPFDGLIGPGVMFGINHASLYTFDVRRACTSGRIETAGALFYGAYDLGGCEDFSPVPTTQKIGGRDECQDVTYLTITNVAAGPTSVESTSTATTWAIRLNKEDITLPPVSCR